MNYGIIAELSGEAENAFSGDGEPAFRCGPALPLARWPIRGADLRPGATATVGRERVIVIRWGRRVAWEKPVRACKCR